SNAEPVEAVVGGDTVGGGHANRSGTADDITSCVIQALHPLHKGVDDRAGDRTHRNSGAAVATDDRVRNGEGSPAGWAEIDAPKFETIDGAVLDVDRAGALNVYPILPGAKADEIEAAQDDGPVSNVDRDGIDRARRLNAGLA